MTKRECYDRLLNEGVNERTAIALCNFFDSTELEEFVEFLEYE